MTMNDELCPGAPDESRKVRRIHEPPAKARGRILRRVMDHHDPDEAAPPGFIEKTGSSLNLAPA
jgi:hypothetical protein